MGWYAGTRLAWASGKGRRGSHFTIGGFANVDFWYAGLPVPMAGATAGYDFM